MGFQKMDGQGMTILGGKLLLKKEVLVVVIGLKNSCSVSFVPNFTKFLQILF